MGVYRYRAADNECPWLHSLIYCFIHVYNCIQSGHTADGDTWLLCWPQILLLLVPVAV